MSLVDDVLSQIKDNKTNAENGNINCIPFGFDEVRHMYPGTRKGSIIIYTGATKASKSQITTYLQLICPIEYAYFHPEQLKIHNIYFSMEETKGDIMKRIMSHYLFKWYNIRISNDDLDSCIAEMPLSNEIIEIIESDKMQSILRFYEECIDFYDDIHTTIGQDKIIRKYFDDHGHIEYLPDTFVDENGVERHKIDKYVPDDPLEYVQIFSDHIGLFNPNKAQCTLYTAIEDWSNAAVRYKNLYNAIVVGVQQQVDSEQTSVSAQKLGNVTASKSGLKDNKSSGNAVTQLWGINDLASFPNVSTEWDEYVARFGHNFRMLELILNRKGQGNLKIPLLFDGCTCTYWKLPAVDSNEIGKYTKLVDRFKAQDADKRQLIMSKSKAISFFISTTKRKSLFNKLKFILNDYITKTKSKGF